MKNFSEKVALITGAGSGIGRALALELATSGCALALVDWNKDSLEETKQVIKLAKTGKISPIPTQEWPLEKAGEVLENLRKGEITGRAILRPFST